MRRRTALVRSAVGCVIVGVGMLLLAAPSAGASSFDSSIDSIDSFSTAPSATQAGGHPDVTTSFLVTNHNSLYPNYPSVCFCEDASDAAVHLPAGLIGDPHATPQCTAVEFGNSLCPPDTQVGVTIINLRDTNFPFPVYNLETDSEHAGLLGFQLPIVLAPTYIVLSARTGGDYGLDATLAGITHAVELKGAVTTLWGVPADPSHDAQRVPLGGECYGETCTGNPPLASDVPPKPLIENPTTCAGLLPTSLDVAFYDHGTAHADATWAATTGCDQLSFNPSLSAQPTTTQTDSASGLDVNLSVPQNESPSTPSPSEIRATTVTLPQGFSINPNAADGKTSCSDAAANVGTGSDGPATCPDFSKIGTISITSSALPAPLPGSVYIGDPKPGDRYRLILAADGFATHIKLAGSVAPDPNTGQLVASFQNLPQAPFSDFNLHFFGSERGVLATPTQCGTYPIKTTFTPWDAQLPDQNSTQFFTLDSGPNGTPCPGAQRPFNPGFQAGATDNTAAAHSPFSIDLTRADGEQNLAALNVSTPPGFAAVLKGIPYCPEAAIKAAADSSYSGAAELANPSCPAASQVGTATAGAGAGTHPYYAPGKVYLAGPYKSAPLSLVVITPAVSGPYDLGDVVVRAALQVDPTDAHVTAVSDPLPQILQGIPLRLRSVLINLDRPNFALNPTNCDPFKVSAQVFGDQGAQANPTSPFQVANCADLGFSPKLAMRLSGPTLRNGHPGFHTTLNANPGEANIERVAVTLPPTEQLDQSHLNAPCTRAQFAAKACPAASVIGQATATTPLLDQPLSGPVYLETRGNLLPDIVVALKGPASQPIELDLAGKVDTVKGALRTTFGIVPDAPVTSFSLDLSGGSRGLIVNNTNICKASLHAVVKVAGQNGRNADQGPAVKAPCGKARHRRHRRHAKKAVR